MKIGSGLVLNDLIVLQYPPSPGATMLPSAQVPVVSQVQAQDYSALMQPPQPRLPGAPHPTLVSKQVQTDLTCQSIQEFETQASSDLELRNNKIEELNRVS